MGSLDLRDFSFPPRRPGWFLRGILGGQGKKCEEQQKKKSAHYKGGK